jgi:hypothetical protein
LLIALGTLAFQRGDSDTGPRVVSLESDPAPSVLVLERTGFDEQRLFHVAPGVRLLLAPGSRGTLSEVSERSRLVQVNEGHFELDIDPSKGTPKLDWEVAAGQYVVRVSNAALSVNFDPVGRAFHLAVSRGSVHVRGGAFGAGVLVEQGEERRAQASPDSALFFTEPNTSRDVLVGLPTTDESQGRLGNRTPAPN